MQDEAAARAAAVADGLVEPLTVEIEQQVEPTERQMDYALELEAMIPEGACKDDLSAIISFSIYFIVSHMYLSILDIVK